MTQQLWALGQKSKGLWFKPCCGYLMLCVVQLAFGCQCDLYLKYLFDHKGKFKLMEEPL